MRVKIILSSNHLLGRLLDQVESFNTFVSTTLVFTDTTLVTTDTYPLYDPYYKPPLSQNASSELITSDSEILSSDGTIVYTYCTIYSAMGVWKAKLKDKLRGTDRLLPLQTAGIAFPVIIPSSGKVELSYGPDIIKSSLIIILSWQLRTRYFNGQFGSRIYEALEDPNDDILSMLVRKFTLDSIEDWEPRVELKSLSVHRPEPHKLNLELVYNIKELNVEDSVFYTYYIN